MQRPIRLKIFSITASLLGLMVIVTWLSVLNFRQLNNQVRALSDYYLPLQEQVASVEILIRQQMVHMERLLAGMQANNPDLEYLSRESNHFDNRGVNADQVVDSSLRMLSEASSAKDIKLDNVTLAILGRQLPAIQTARQRFHAAFRMFQIEAEEGTPRSQKIMRDTLLKEKDSVDVEIGKTIDILNTLTKNTAARAKQEEQRATQLNWVVTAIATLLGLIFAWAISRSLVDSVKRLMGGTRAVEDGNLEVEIHVETRDEMATLANSFNHMVLGLRERETIRETFGKYVDPRVVRGLLENRLPAEGGENHVMSVFFSDLEGFTQLSEGLTPDAVVRFLNRYFSLMAELIRERQGIIDKYIGDAVMAFWGPPFTDEKSHAALCCHAALSQMARLEAFRAELPDIFGTHQALPKVNVRMGIATGEVTVGNIGSDTARGYTVIGDTVNLASRLEQANKFYGTRILVNEETQIRVKDELALREIDSLRVAGKREPVRVFELLGSLANQALGQQQMIATFERGLSAYRKQNWDEAEAAFHAGLTLTPGDPPCQVFLDRIQAFRRSPPAADWDGVWIATSK